MSTLDQDPRVETELVTRIIRKQVGTGVLMSLGAHKLGYYTNEKGQPVLVFMARLLPFNAKGKRLETPRNMRVMVTLNALDLYDVEIQYRRRGQLVTHFESSSVYGPDLSMLMLAVDSDYDLEEAGASFCNRVE